MVGFERRWRKTFRTSLCIEVHIIVVKAARYRFDLIQYNKRHDLLDRGAGADEITVAIDIVDAIDRSPILREQESRRQAKQ